MERLGLRTLDWVDRGLGLSAELLLQCQHISESIRERLQHTEIPLDFSRLKPIEPKIMTWAPSLKDRPKAPRHLPRRILPKHELQEARKTAEKLSGPEGELLAKLETSSFLIGHVGLDADRMRLLIGVGVPVDGMPSPSAVAIAAVFERACPGSFIRSFNFEGDMDWNGNGKKLLRCNVDLPLPSFNGLHPISLPIPEPDGSAFSNLYAGDLLRLNALQNKVAGSYLRNVHWENLRHLVPALLENPGNAEEMSRSSTYVKELIGRTETILGKLPKPIREKVWAKILTLFPMTPEMTPTRDECESLLQEYSKMLKSLTNVAGTKSTKVKRTILGNVARLHWYLLPREVFENHPDLTANALHRKYKGKSKKKKKSA